MDPEIDVFRVLIFGAKIDKEIIMELSQSHLGVKPVRWSFAQTHPVLAYLLIAFG